MVKWTMRAVLASPMVVLVVWSTCALLFTSSHGNPSKSSTLRQATQRQQPKSHNNVNSNVVIRPRPHPQRAAVAGAAMNGNYMATNSQTRNQVVQPEQFVAPDPALPQVRPEQFLYSQAQPQYMMQVQEQQDMPIQPRVDMPVQQQGQVNQAQYMMTPRKMSTDATQERHMIPVIGPLGSTATSTSNQNNEASTPVIVQPPPPHGSSYSNTFLQRIGSMRSTGTGSTSSASTTTTATNAQAPLLIPPLLSQADRERPDPRGQAEPVDPSLRTHLVEIDANRTVTHRKKKQQVYYYDANAASSSGRLSVPSVVYDEDGNQVSMHTLQLQGAEIYLEPPQELLAAAPQQMAINMPNTESWGENSRGDQSIIVSTVAVMALLVGALSARRLRSRNILSACIENESLEDEVAYDTAYTTNTDNSYNTFGGWKGDLEKFDV